jgi:predicted esterase
VFHGGANPVVLVTESRKMVDALKGLNADVKYTEYEGIGHNSWDKAYNEAEATE